LHKWDMEHGASVMPEGPAAGSEEDR